MKRKFIYGIMCGIIFLIIGTVLGLLTGMHIGGNYFVEFEFGGVRGYEAVGKIGAILGVVLGTVIGILLGVKKADKRRK